MRLVSFQKILKYIYAPDPQMDQDPQQFEKIASQLF
jgi:hypothetical protein